MIQMVRAIQMKHIVQCLINPSTDDAAFEGFQQDSDNDEWYAEMEEMYGNGRFMQGLYVGRME